VFDWIPNRKKYEKKTVWAYSIIGIVSFIVLLLDKLDVDVPSITLQIQALVDAIINPK
jgi:hypothetical protein